MAWWEDKNRTTYIATFKNEKEMQQEVEAAARFGWMPQGMAGVGGHINVGRTVTTAALTGGISLLFGASRSKDKTTITFLRDPAWVARTQLDDALQLLQGRQARLQHSQQQMERAIRNVAERLGTGSGLAQAVDVGAEMESAKALKDSIEARESVAKERQATVTALSGVVACYRQAQTLGASFPPATVDFNASIEALRLQGISEDQRLEKASRLKSLQGDVVKAAENLRDLSRKVDKCRTRLAEAQKRLELARAEFEGTPPDRRERQQQRVTDAEAQVLKHQTELVYVNNEQRLSSDSLTAIYAGRRELVSSTSTEVGDSAWLTPLSPDKEIPSVAADWQVAAAPGAPEDVISQLSKLAELHKAGILTDEEFTGKKAELLSRL